MPDFTHRSYEKELLDRQDIPFADIEQNMRELEYINSRLGGHSITIRGLRELLPLSANPVSICEIGCGGGDNLKAIEAWSIRHHRHVQLTGIDINPDCIQYARENCRHLRAARFIQADYRDIHLANDNPCIIFSSLFCHHLDNTQFIEMLEWSKQNSTIGFFINDLHRHPIAYYAIKWLTSWWSGSYLVKNDAPLSVRRGFKRKELEMLLKNAGFSNYSIRWQWAFRWLIIIKN